MKELKFKVWNTVKQNMFNPQGITFDINSLAPFAIKVPGRTWEPAGKYKLIQWTGLSDNNGTDVFEGDFIKILSNLYKVIWNETTASFELVALEDSLKRSISDVDLGDVVGNQFQNPNLHR